jgi:fused signal recognition particle receptor
MERLRAGLRRTGAGLASVFSGARLDESLYEELESALLMADAGVPATAHVLEELRRRVRQAGRSDPTRH